MTKTVHSILERQSIARNSIYGIFSQLLISITTVFVAGYIATSLGVKDYGKFVFAFSFVQTISAFSNMGIHVVQLREIARNKSDASAFFGSTIILRMILAFFSYLIIVLLVTVLNYPTITRRITYIAGLTLFFEYMRDSFNAVFRGYEKLQFSATLNIVTSALSLFSRAFVIYLGYKLYLLTLTATFTSFVSAVLTYYVVRTLFFTPEYTLSLPQLKYVLRLILPFYWLNVFMMAYKRLDILLISLLCGDSAVGLYNASAAIILRLAVVSSAISAAIFPVMSRLVGENKTVSASEIYRHGLLVLFLIVLPISVLIYYSAPNIILLIYDHSFSDSILILKLLSLTLPFGFFSFHMHNALFSFNKERVVTKITATYVIVNLISNLVLIPQYEQVGAALSLIISQGLNFFLTLYYLTFLLNLKSFDRRFLGVIVSSIIMIWVILNVPFSNIILACTLSLLAYLFGLFLFGVLNYSSLSTFKSMLIDNVTVR